MPWRECCKMDERLRFVARLLDGEKMAVLCREFDISRKTGYKILKRYNDSGLEGLTDRSRRPYRHANQLPFQIEKLIGVPSRTSPAGARRRSGSGWPGSTRTSTPQQSQRCMQFWTATAWSSAASNDATERR